MIHSIHWFNHEVHVDWFNHEVDWFNHEVDWFNHEVDWFNHEVAQLIFVLAPAEEPPEPKEDSTPKGPAKYIPPAQRAAAAAAARGESPATQSGPTIPAHLRGRKKAAPNLTSEEDFPTLGGGAPPPQPQDR